jgi:hypothetical protein
MLCAGVSEEEGEVEVLSSFSTKVVYCGSLADRGGGGRAGHPDST